MPMSGLRVQVSREGAARFAGTGLIAATNTHQIMAVVLSSPRVPSLSRECRECTEGIPNHLRRCERRATMGNAPDGTVALSSPRPQSDQAQRWCDGCDAEIRSRRVPECVESLRQHRAIQSNESNVAFDSRDHRHGRSPVP
jgi:hypothetical protein